MTRRLRLALVWCLRVTLAAAFLALGYQLINLKAPFLFLVDETGSGILQVIVGPLMWVGALLLLFPRTTKFGVGVLALASLTVGLATLDRIPSWDLSSHFVILLMFGPFLLWLYLLSDGTA